MNKYLVLIIVFVLLMGAGIGYRVFLLPKSSVPVTTGTVREITITSQKDKWNFVPEVIEADRGDKIILTVVNEDNYDHGIAIDAFGVSQRMPANSTIKIEFVVTQEGSFPFYCSVPCGDGVVDSKPRGHFDMVGRVHVRNIAGSAQ